MTTTFDEEMRAALAAGEPNLDNVSDGTVDGPDICGMCGGVGQVDDGDRLCPECLGEGLS